MAIQALDTTVKTVTNRLGQGAYYYVTGNALAATTTLYIPAPTKGTLARVVWSNGSTAQTSGNGYRVGITNAGNAGVTMVDGSANGANDFQGTTYTGNFPAAQAKKDCTLTTTTANLAVSEGDILVVTLTVVGTVTYCGITLQFEAIP